MLRVNYRLNLFGTKASRQQMRNGAASAADAADLVDQ